MAPSLSSLRSRPLRAQSLEREELHARWGDRSITAPTAQKPAAEPVVPVEWASPATTLVDSSPDLSFNKDFSPVEVLATGERNNLTISIPLPWKRKRRARSASPGVTRISSRPSAPDTHACFVSPEEVPSPAWSDDIKHQRKADSSAPAFDTLSKPDLSVPHPQRNVHLKSPMFPLAPVSKEVPRPARNVDLLTSELDAIALGQKVRSRKDLNITPVGTPSPRLSNEILTQQSETQEKPQRPADIALPMVGYLAHRDSLSPPESTIDTLRRSPNNNSPVMVNVGPGKHVSLSVLSPVEESHERNQLSSNPTSIETSPTSPAIAPARSSLSRIVATPVDSAPDPRIGQHCAAPDSVAALNSHPTSRAPRSTSISRYGTERQRSRERPSSRQSTARPVSPVGRRSSSTTRVATQGPSVRRKSSSRRTPAAASTLPVSHAYRRSSDFLTSRHVAESIFTANPQTTVYAAYPSRRSRSVEPRPSTRLAVDPMRSPTDSLSSGSTEFDPASDEEDHAAFSSIDSDQYFEARQMWNGVAGEGKKGFYANVADDYRLIGKDVTTTNKAEDERKTTIPKPDVTQKRIGTSDGEGRVKIAGVDPIAVSGGQHMVPSSEELWG